MIVTPHPPGGAAATSEPDWRRWLAATDLPPLDLPGPGRPVVVAPSVEWAVATVGGLLAQLRDAVVLVVTGAPTAAESRCLAVLGLPADAVRRTEPAESTATRRAPGPTPAEDPPGAGRWESPRAGSALRPVVADAVGAGAWCVAPWRNDGDPEAERTGQVVAEVAAAAGATIVECPYRMWGWAVAGDARVPWERARQWELSPSTLVAKARALAMLRGGGAETVGAFLRAYETGFVA